MWVEAILGTVAILSALGVILARKPVYAGLSFLLTLIMLSGLYLQLSAHFIAAMQILVYAGAILVIFMFVIILFQDAHQQIEKYQAGSAWLLVGVAAFLFASALGFVGSKLLGRGVTTGVSEGFGTVQSLGKSLFLQYFFPFEAITLIFLIAVIGTVYIGRRE